MRDEGVQTTVSVHMREMGGRQLYLDGLHQASDGRDVVLLHRQIGHLPVLLHPNPRARPGDRSRGRRHRRRRQPASRAHIDVVELASGVERGASWFTHINENLLHGRTSDCTWTMHGIICCSAGPEVRRDYGGRDSADTRGAGMLYSREYFELVRRALTERGVMVQWIGLRSDLHYELIAVRSSTSFRKRASGSTVRCSSDRSAALDRKLELAERFAAARAAAVARGCGLPDSESLLGHHLAGPEDLRRFIGEVQS